MQEIWNRLYQLIIKTISFKCLVGIVLPTVLLCFKQIDQNAWWIAVAATLTARTAEKFSQNKTNALKSVIGGE